MWFKELFELWRKDNSLSQALEDSNRMLEQTLIMFKESVRSLRESDEGELKINVYEMDQMVNQYIRKVRRKVLKYLAVTGSMNIIPGLVLLVSLSILNASAIIPKISPIWPGRIPGG